jgi:hypothetical protein
MAEYWNMHVVRRCEYPQKVGDILIYTHIYLFIYLICLVVSPCNWVNEEMETEDV